MKKYIFIIILFILSTSLSHASLDKIWITIYPPLDDAYKYQITKFTNEFTNLKVRLDVMGFGDHHSDLLTRIAERTYRSDYGDLYTIDYNYLGNIGYFKNLLVHFNANKYKTNFLLSNWKQASFDKNTLIGIPITISPACAYWRTDILNKYKLNFKNINTLDDLFYIGKIVTKDLDGDGTNDQWLMSDYVELFNIILKSGSYCHFDGNGNPIINWPLIKKALYWIKRFYNAGMIANIRTFDSKWYQAIRSTNGGFVFNIHGPWFANFLEKYITNLSGAYRVSLIPALQTGAKPLYAYDGGTFLVVYNNYEYANPNEWQLVEYLALNTKNVIDVYHKTGLIPSWLPAWNDETFKIPNQYFGGQNLFTIWMDIAKHINTEYLNMKDALVINVLSYYAHDAIVNNFDINITIEKSKKEINNIISNGY